jgi:hypothetical protein
LNAPPEQVSQSGWHERHAPLEEKVEAGQLVVQVPLRASWEVQVRQKVAVLMQVLHDESHAGIERQTN